MMGYKFQFIKFGSYYLGQNNLDLGMQKQREVAQKKDKGFVEKIRDGEALFKGLLGTIIEISVRLVLTISTLYTLYLLVVEVIFEH